jgi:hypothetical protein
MRRISLVLVVAAASGLVLGAMPAEARPGIGTRTVGFTLSSVTCPNLPDGTTIEGSGTETSITTEWTDARGVTMIINATHTHGTATDQDQNVYVFDYSNEFRVSNTVDDPDLFLGVMTDHFGLAGPGAAKLNNGFAARVSFSEGFSIFSADPISSHGDPIGFPTGEAHCDPL